MTKPKKVSSFHVAATLPEAGECMFRLLLTRFTKQAKVSILCPQSGRQKTLQRGNVEKLKAHLV